MRPVPPSADRARAPSASLQAAILAIGLASSTGIALAGGCAAGRSTALAEPPAPTMVLTDELVRHYRWQPGLCRLTEPTAADAEAPQQQANSPHAAALALEQILAEAAIARKPE